MAKELIEKALASSITQDTEVYDPWVYIREWREKFGRLPEDEDELAVCINYVNKRTNHPEWKPTEEQLEAFASVLNSYYTHCGSGPSYNVVAELYGQLKTL